MQRLITFALRMQTAFAACAVLGWLASPSASYAQNQNPPVNRSVPGNADAPIAKPAPAPAPTTPDEATLRIMRLWEQKTADMQKLHVKFNRTIKEFDDLTTRPGQALLKSPNLATLIYEEKDINPANKKPHEERYVFNGKELWKYITKEKKVYIYPVKQDQSNGAFERGPLRFLFNMKMADALNRYDVKVLDKQKDPKIEEKYHVIRVVPRDPRERQEISIIYIWLRKVDYMPGIIRIKSADGNSEDFELTQIAKNEDFDEAIFKGIRPKGWAVITDPLGEKNPGLGPVRNTSPSPTPNQPGAPKVGAGNSGLAPRTGSNGNAPPPRRN